MRRLWRRGSKNSPSLCQIEHVDASSITRRRVNGLTVTGIGCPPRVADFFIFDALKGARHINNDRCEAPQRRREIRVWVCYLGRRQPFRPMKTLMPVRCFIPRSLPTTMLQPAVLTTAYRLIATAACQSTRLPALSGWQHLPIMRHNPCTRLR